MIGRIGRLIAISLFLLLALGFYSTDKIAFADLSAGLMGYYPFNGNANDESGNGNDGTIVGPTTLTTDRFGNPDSAYHFAGVDVNTGFINIWNSSTLSLETFTIAIWFKWESEHPTDIYRCLITKGSTAFAYYQNYQMGVDDATGRVFGRVGHGPASIPPSTTFWSTGSVQDGEPHLAVFTYDSVAGTGDLYVDDVSMDPKSGLLPAWLDQTIIVTLGIWHSPIYGEWGGDMDDVRIYNRVLSRSEITELYQENVTVEVAIDIKPKSCPNYVSVKNKGTLAVAIPGTVDLDVKDIDIATIELEGISPVKSRFRDITTPSGLDSCGCLVLSGDGTKDLILQFDTRAIIATLGDVQNGDKIPLMLTGMLQDGTPIEGSDCVVIKKGKK